MPDPFRHFDADLRRHEDPRIRDLWAAAKQADDANCSYAARTTFLEAYRSGELKRELRRAAPAGTARGVRTQRISGRARSGAATHREIGRWIRVERSFAGMTQSDLAEQAGLARTALTRIELGERALSFAEACRIGDVLGVSIEAFRPPGDAS